MNLCNFIDQTFKGNVTNLLSEYTTFAELLKWHFCLSELLFLCNRELIILILNVCLYIFICIEILWKRSIFLGTEKKSLKVLKIF